MNRNYYFFTGWLWALAVVVNTGHCRANHLYGGNMSLQKTTSANTYQLALTLFFDKRYVDPATGYDPPEVFLFKKSDNTLVDRILLAQQHQQDLFGNTSPCSTVLPLSILRIRYSADLELSPAKYDDPLGYYVIWERCCRNRDIVNINDPGNTGMTFRIDFPPVWQNNKPFINSSPDFSTPPADYVCINKPYRFSFRATDADGDRLQYELVDPLAGYTSEFPVTNRIGNGQSRAFYPAVRWNPGYSAQKPMGAKPNLQINATSGELTVKATQQGLYAFAVLVREFRHGIEIGQVRREYQLPVLDCQLNQVTNLPPIVRANGNPVSVLQHCDTSPVILRIDTESDYEYQWLRNGQDLVGETSAVLSVTEDGTYAVRKKFIENCGQDTTSQSVQIYCQAPLYFPAAFTPNGDGLNDVWQLISSVPIEDIEVSIYDRWGEPVFYSKGYNTPWDGTNQKQKLPPGLYSYLIQMPRQPPFRGTVQLIL